jgi:hypothetical protein
MRTVLGDGDGISDGRQAREVRRERRRRRVVELEADGPSRVYAVAVEERDRSPSDERCRSR